MIGNFAFTVLMLAHNLGVGIVEGAAKDATKGVTQGVKENVNSGDVKKGVSEVTKGAIKGAKDELNADKKGLGDAVSAITSNVTTKIYTDLEAQLGPNGDGPLATSLAETTRKVTAAAVQGVVSQIPLMFIVLAFVGGAAAVLLGGLAVFLVMMFRARRVSHA